MGFGDSIIATADARRVYEQTGKQVVFGDGKTAHYDKQIFKHNPKVNPQGSGIWIPNYPGCRPYIRETKKGRIIYNDRFRVEAGEIFLDEYEETKGDYILVETSPKLDYMSGINKQWHYWEELLKHDFPWRINKQQTIFRDALNVLRGARLYVGTDGALHHAAAALGIPAIVIWTGYSSPRHLGYDSQINLHDGSEPCGTYDKECPHCKTKSLAISVEEVLEAVRREIDHPRISS